MAKAAAPLPNISVWTTQTLRLTAFHQLGPQKEDHDWWETFVGAAPETKNQKPREGGYEVTGPYSGGILTLRADVMRFDWLFTPAVTLDKPAGGFPVIGPTSDSLSAFLPIVRNWLEKSPDIFRLAFGAVVMQPVTDRIEGYRLLNSYLPSVELDPEHSSDFSYSINRPRIAKNFEGIRVNRVSKWAVMIFHAMMIRMIAGQGAMADAVPGQALQAMHLELDISTDADRQTPLPKNNLPALFDHLVEIGTEIILRGDIK